MGIFEDVKLGWNGAQYVIPAHRVLGAVAAIEEHLTAAELVIAMQRGKPPFGKLSQAYAALLSYAGCQGVSAEDLYAGMFDKDVSVRVLAAVNALYLLMMPPAAVAGLTRDANRGKPQAASKPSKRSTKRRSARAAG